MCQELNLEIERGEAAIKALALHLVVMGASRLERTVAINDQLIEIKVSVKAKI